ncbi:PSP1 domain-containing protein [Desulfofalx alkaliphila]|uniref:PSP1 domain-containing protein n=1 Tax=Desulfofalx alkaliphila TaxID=105483 RepID=UPI0004E0B68D|nr:stage 0 sporulation family protein [Desulfofalx alkaliphila]
MAYKVVGIRFKKAGKIYFFDPDGLELQIGDHAIVETTRGIEYGQVVAGPGEVEEDEVVAPLKKVLRKATEEDKAQLSLNKEKEKVAYQVGLEKIAAHGLPMKLISVEQTFDGNKIIFYFTADGRIDFRELVKDLAAVFRTRIELRQIGVRDEAKMVGGLGCCGRELCCASWLADFAPVSIRMAKDQNLSLNPTKISGICGRLMCCLKYENDVYEEAKEHFPEVGTLVNTAEGDGRVVGFNIFKKTVTVEIKENKHIFEFPVGDVVIKKIKGENSGASTRTDS